jgi:hypothetical protein
MMPLCIIWIISIIVYSLSRLVLMLGFVSTSRASNHYLSKHTVEPLSFHLSHPRLVSFPPFFLIFSVLCSRGFIRAQQELFQFCLFRSLISFLLFQMTSFTCHFTLTSYLLLDLQSNIENMATQSSLAVPESKGSFIGPLLPSGSFSSSASEAKGPGLGS